MFTIIRITITNYCREKPYDLKNAKKILLKIITQKVTEKDALKLNSDLITPNIIALENEIVRTKIQEITYQTWKQSL